MIFKISSEKIEEFIEKQHSIDGMVFMHDFELWLEEQPRVGEWIPCSERLPEKPEYGIQGYIVQQAGVAEPYSAYWDFDEKWTDNENNVLEGIIAWQPLPVPYEEGESS